MHSKMQFSAESSSGKTKFKVAVRAREMRSRKPSSCKSASQRVSERQEQILPRFARSVPRGSPARTANVIRCLGSSVPRGTLLRGAGGLGGKKAQNRGQISTEIARAMHNFPLSKNAAKSPANPARNADWCAARTHFFHSGVRFCTKAARWTRAPGRGRLISHRRICRRLTGGRCASAVNDGGLRRDSRGS
jgi:hypothetical protein